MKRRLHRIYLILIIIIFFYSILQSLIVALFFAILCPLFNRGSLSWFVERWNYGHTYATAPALFDIFMTCRKNVLAKILLCKTCTSVTCSLRVTLSSSIFLPFPLHSRRNSNQSDILILIIIMAIIILFVRYALIGKTSDDKERERNMVKNLPTKIRLVVFEGAW